MSDERRISTDELLERRRKRLDRLAARRAAQHSPSDRSDNSFDSTSRINDDRRTDKGDTQNEILALEKLMQSVVDNNKDDMAEEVGLDDKSDDTNRKLSLNISPSMSPSVGSLSPIKEGEGKSSHSHTRIRSSLSSINGGGESPSLGRSSRSSLRSEGSEDGVRTRRRSRNDILERSERERARRESERERERDRDRERVRRGGDRDRERDRESLSLRREGYGDRDRERIRREGDDRDRERDRESLRREGYGDRERERIRREGDDRDRERDRESLRREGDRDRDRDRESLRREGERDRDRDRERYKRDADRESMRRERDRERERYRERDRESRRQSRNQQDILASVNAAREAGLISKNNGILNSSDHRRSRMEDIEQKLQEVRNHRESMIAKKNNLDDDENSNPENESLRIRTKNIYGDNDENESKFHKEIEEKAKQSIDSPEIIALRNRISRLVQNEPNEAESPSSSFPRKRPSVGSGEIDPKIKALLSKRSSLDASLIKDLPAIITPDSDQSSIRRSFQFTSEEALNEGGDSMEYPDNDKSMEMKKSPLKTGLSIDGYRKRTPVHSPISIEISAASPDETSNNDKTSPIKEKEPESAVSNIKENTPIDQHLESSPIGQQLEPSPIEQQLEPSPIEQQLEPSPIEQQLEPSPIEQQLEPSPIEQQLEPSPIEQQLEPSPIEQQLEPSPVDQRLEPSPVDQRLEPSPIEQQLEPSPIEQKLEPSPIDQQLEPSPIEQKLEPSPIEQKLEPSPIDQQLEPSPIDQQLEPSPVDQQYEPSPIDQQYEPSPVDQQYEPSPIDQQYEPSPVDRQYEKSPVNRQYEPSSVDRQYEKSPVNRQYERSPIDRQYERSPIDRQYEPSPVDQQYGQSPVYQQYEQSSVDQQPESSAPMNEYEEKDFDGNYQRLNDEQLKNNSNITTKPLSEFMKNDMGPEGEDEFWESMITEFKDYFMDIPSYTLQKIRGGIPHHLRGKVWKVMSGADNNQLDALYDQLLEEESPFEKQILRDVARTFPHMSMFSDRNGNGQHMLFNLMKAYSLYDTEVGYCQGLCFIVGPLLMQRLTEKEAFSIFVRLMEETEGKSDNGYEADGEEIRQARRYAFRNLFTPRMPGVNLMMYQFDFFLKTYLPALYGHLLRHNVVSTMYASQWFLTIFAYNFPLPLVFRIFDILFAEGPNVTILRFAIAILRRNQSRLLEMETFEELLEFLKGNKIFEIYGEGRDAHNDVVNDAMSMCSIISDSELVRLRQEYERTDDAKQFANHGGEMELLSARMTIRELRQQRTYDHNLIEELKTQIEILSEEINEARRDVDPLRDENESLRIQCHELKELLTNEDKRLQSIWEDTVHKIEQENAKLQRQLQQTESQLIDAKVLMANMEDEKDMLRNSIEVLKNAFGVNEVRQALNNYMNSNSRSGSQISIHRSRSDSINSNRSGEKSLSGLGSTSLSNLSNNASHWFNNVSNAISSGISNYMEKNQKGTGKEDSSSNSSSVVNMGMHDEPAASEGEPAQNQSRWKFGWSK